MYYWLAKILGHVSVVTVPPITAGKRDLMIMMSMKMIIVKIR